MVVGRRRKCSDHVDDVPVWEEILRVLGVV
jgi:hypothetical protein